MKEKVVIALTTLLLFLLSVNECNAQKYRIVSLAPSITEMLFVIGIGEDIIGIDEYSNYPAKTRDIERIGTFFSPNMERIILLRPDYVFAHREMTDDKSEYLRGLGIEVIEIAPKNIDEICENIEMLGRIFNKEKRAKIVVSNIKSRLDTVRQRIKGKRPKVFIQLFDDPLTTSSSFLGDVIEMAGGENIAGDVVEDSGIFSYEFLIERNPDIVLIAGFSEGSNLPASINAVKNNRVYKDLDLDSLLRPGPRVIESIEWLNRIFYEAD